MEPSEGELPASAPPLFTAPLPMDPLPNQTVSSLGPTPGHLLTHCSVKPSRWTEDSMSIHGLWSLSGT